MGSWPEVTRWSNDETMVWLLIESLEGIGNSDAILEVPGISAIVPGQNARLSLMREGRVMEITVQVGRRPSPS